MTERFSTKKLVLSALFAALAYGHYVHPHPHPSTGGYIHPGDAIVILCGVFLDPYPHSWRPASAHCMADLLGRIYFIYVPITFVIKGTGGILHKPCLRQVKEPEA